MKRKLMWGMLVALFVFVGCLLSPCDAAAATQQVYVVPVEGAIGAGLARFVERAVNDAVESRADQLVVKINTPGGAIAAAIDIRDTLVAAPLPVVAYVSNRAWSAGVLVALAADEIYMTPGASIGAAEPRPAEEKVISAWRSELESTAELSGRDPELAAAMVDADVELPGVVEKGKILTLTAPEAVELGFADGLADSKEALYAAKEWEPASTTTAKENSSERLARFVTNPSVAPILLALGFLGLIAEFLVPGFGVPGIVGIAAFTAYFGGHMIAGLAGWPAIFAFIAGVVLLAIEIFVPGFGVFGAAGIAAIGGSIFLAAQSFEQAVRSLGISLLVAVVGIFVVVKYVGPRGLWQRLLLSDQLATEHGYVSQSPPVELVGSRGVASSPLRPAGTVRIEGEPYSVVTEGGFIEKGETVEVVEIQGARIVVRSVED